MVAFYINIESYHFFKQKTNSVQVDLFARVQQLYTDSEKIIVENAARILAADSTEILTSSCSAWQDRAMRRDETPIAADTQLLQPLPTEPPQTMTSSSAGRLPHPFPVS